MSARLLCDPVDRQIVDRLHLGGRASAAEIALALGASPRTVRRRLAKLVEAGVVERRGSDRGGASGPVYSADLRRALVGRDQISHLPPRIYDETHVRLLRLLFDEAKEAVDAGTFYADQHFVLTRFVMPLDERGEEEAQALHEGLGYSIAELAEIAKRRIERGEEALIAARANVLLFKAPDPWPVAFTEPSPSPGSTRGASGPHRVDAFLTLATPLRIKLLDALSLRPAGARELAGRLCIPVEKVRYELKRLQVQQMVRVESRRRRRGTEELIYICENRELTLEATDISSYAGNGLEAFCRRMVGEVFRAALAATRAGAFHDREDFVTYRVPMLIDRRGFAEISELMTSVLERLFGLREECLARLGESGEPPRPAISNLLLFGLPPPRSGAAREPSSTP